KGDVHGFGHGQILCRAGGGRFLHPYPRQRRRGGQLPGTDGFGEEETCSHHQVGGNRIDSRHFNVRIRRRCMSKIVACYKWVLDESDIRINSDLSVDFSKAKGKISDYDRNAIEAAVKL